MNAESTFPELLNAIDVLVPVGRDGRIDESRARTQPVAELLACLASRMMELCAEREAEVARFLAWLEDQLGCAMDDLTGRTTVASYHEQPDGVDALLRVIQKNRARTKIDVRPARRYGSVNPARERIVEGYERSMARLEPLRRQIELTDRLIDLVVYRVYGLTPEDVRVVDEMISKTTT